LIGSLFHRTFLRGRLPAAARESAAMPRAGCGRARVPDCSRLHDRGGRNADTSGAEDAALRALFLRPSLLAPPAPARNQSPRRERELGPTSAPVHVLGQLGNRPVRGPRDTRRPPTETASRVEARRAARSECAPGGPRVRWVRDRVGRDDEGPAPHREIGNERRRRQIGGEAPRPESHAGDRFQRAPRPSSNREELRCRNPLGEGRRPNEAASRLPPDRHLGGSARRREAAGEAARILRGATTRSPEARNAR